MGSEHYSFNVNLLVVKIKFWTALVNVVFSYYGYVRKKANNFRAGCEALSVGLAKQDQE